MASHDLINAFDDCVERLREGQSIDDCLRIYPQHAAVLLPMLETGLAIQRAAPVIPSAARARVRARVMQAAVQPSHHASWLTSRLTLMAASILVVLFGAALVTFFNRTDNNHLRTEPIPASETASITPGISPTTAPTEALTATASLTATSQPSQTPAPTIAATATLGINPLAIPSPTTTPTRAPECRFAVTASSANLREGPGTGYPVLRFAYAGDDFEVVALHTGDEWVEISTPDGPHWIATTTGELRGDCSAVPDSDTPFMAGDDGSNDSTPDAAIATPAGDDHGGGQDDSSGPGGPDDSSEITAVAAAATTASLKGIRARAISPSPGVCLLSYFTPP